MPAKQPELDRTIYIDHLAGMEWLLLYILIDHAVVELLLFLFIYIYVN
jgi:hypothetical protein